MYSTSVFLSTIAALLILSPMPSSAGEFWADGVSRDTGWYDINKTWSGTNSAGNIAAHDDNYCWAAAASNVLSWWQDQLPPSLHELPGIPTGEDIYNTIRNKAAFLSGGYSIGAWKWYFHGDTTEYLPNPGGAYYQSYIPESFLTAGTPDSLYITNLWINEYSAMLPISSFRDRLQFAMEKEHCGITLSVNLPTFNNGHAITLWGAEYDDVTNKITKLFITDSDDTKNKGENGHTVHELVTLGCEYYDQTGYIGLKNIDENGNVIDGVYTDGHALLSNVYGLKAYAVPEPASAAFLFLGLGTLLKRRCR